MIRPKEYQISMEIAGPLAMWARPDTGSSPTSYPIPTWSSAKGVFEAVAFFSDGKAWINPIRVEICKPAGSESSGELHYQKYTTNYRGPLKETGKSNYQFSALVVADVCYRLHAIIENGTANPLRKGANPCHYLKDKFNRRLKNGRCHHTPCLGWSEFVPTYWGPVRDENAIDARTEVDTAITLNLVSILKNVFEPEVNGKYTPRFQHGQDAWIREGVFNYVK